ncbi:MAG: hypothetical protein JWO03_2408 [Bacteroidetes bacterium]|nr:hypothetical protein [Bacteroidota bacterium]
MSTSLISISSSAHELFGECIEIYLQSFPPGERQPVERIVQRIDSGTCELYAMTTEQGHVAGIAIIWTFASCDIMFLDYFAIAEDMRHKGYGRIMLHLVYEMAARRSKSLCMEIEHPSYGSNTTERLARLHFYTSNGARILSNIRYMMPSQDSGDDMEMLLLIYTAEKLIPTVDELRTFISHLYSSVYLLDTDHYLVSLIPGGIPGHIELSDAL